METEAGAMNMPDMDVDMGIDMVIVPDMAIGMGLDSDEL